MIPQEADRRICAWAAGDERLAYKTIASRCCVYPYFAFIRGIAHVDKQHRSSQGHDTLDTWKLERRPSTPTENSHHTLPTTGTQRHIAPAKRVIGIRGCFITGRC